ncbi:Sas10/Utp3/C1D family-domain-containing protein [Lentinula edodes]|nr:Sas10/Utp3/C1D family-domain-containing protein [Lentinula edodes]
MASAETRKAKSRLKVLSSSLTEIEAAITPLLSGERTLPEILLALEPLEQAKLQTTLPYLVYDLIFIYLRTRGIDPKTHPVVTELERVRQYFEKIKNAENTPVRGTQVDKAAANRFIKHAISQAQIDADAAGVAYPPKASSSTTRLTPASNSAGVNSSESSASSAALVPVKVTSKMLERQEWQKRVDEAGSGEEEEEEEEDIEGWEEGDGVREDEESEVKTKSISKGKGKAVESLDDTERLGSKRRRPAIDPFEASGMSSSLLPRTRTSSTANPSSSSSSSSSTSTTVDSPSTAATKAEEKKKRRKDKKKKKQKAAIKELKAPDRAGRIVELLAEVAASQGTVVASSSESEED